MINTPIRNIDSRLGLIKIFNQDNISLVKKESIFLNGETLKPNGKTTLNNFFNNEVVYLGLHDDYMQFEIGREQDLFNESIYCSEFKRISDTRIMTIYQVGTARDYNFKKGIWK